MQGLLAEILSVGSVCRMRWFVPGCRAVDSFSVCATWRQAWHRYLVWPSSAVKTDPTMGSKPTSAAVVVCPVSLAHLLYPPHIVISASSWPSALRIF